MFSEPLQQALKATLATLMDEVLTANQARQLLDLIDMETYLGLESKDGGLKPFHMALLSKDFLVISAAERTLSTKLGTIFEACAKLIAAENYPEVQRGYVVSGEVSRQALNEIDRQASRFEPEQHQVKPTWQEMIEAVLAVQQAGDTEHVAVRADLFVKTIDGIEYYFEMKSPKPNKGQCFEMMQRFLRFHLLRHQAAPLVKTYFGMAYNPYGYRRESYKWSQPKLYMPFDELVLIGHEFWELLGGVGAYEEFLAICQAVGNEKQLD